MQDPTENRQGEWAPWINIIIIIIIIITIIIIIIIKRVFVQKVVFHLNIDLHRSNAFPYEKSGTRTRFETGKGNLEWLLNTLTAKIFAREYSMALVRFSVENIGIHLFPLIFTALDV